MTFSDSSLLPFKRVCFHSGIRGISIPVAEIDVVIDCEVGLGLQRVSTLPAERHGPAMTVHFS